MNETKVLQLLKNREFDRVIAICSYELKLKQTDLKKYMEV